MAYERSSTSKKVHAVEEINTLSGKMDELMKLIASKSAPIDPNDMPISTLIENNNEPMDVNVVGRNNFGNNAYRGNFNPKPFRSNSSKNYGNYYKNSNGNYNKMPSDLENNIEEFITSENNFSALVEEKLLKIDDLARNMDRISLEIESLKLDIFHPSMILMSRSKP